jgi:hypothetical protein
MVLEPFMNCKADELQQFMLRQQISILGNPDESNADDVSQTPVLNIRSGNENIELVLIPLQDTLDLVGIWDRQFPSPTWHPSPLILRV